MLLTRKKAAEYLSSLGLPISSHRTLEAYAQQGSGPPFRRFGRRVLYEQSALDEWAEQRLGPPETHSWEDNE